ncbi:MAG: Rrf2 family transcriptional regulator [Coriobacteriales bacterium]
MKAVSRFEIAVLILLMAEFYPDVRSTSSMLGTVAGCNPVTVRNLYSKLKGAGLLEAKPGPHGLSLARDPREINLWEVLAAVEDMTPQRVFNVHSPLNGSCPLSGNIHELLMGHMESALQATRSSLEAVSLYSFAWELPDTYEEPAEERLRIMREALKGLEERYRDEPTLS